jgi:serine/threonine protein kinase
MHELGYVHRDISAGNVLLVPSSSDAPKRGVLTDLEYAIKLGTMLPVHDVCMGTPFFMACEVTAHQYLVFDRNSRDILWCKPPFYYNRLHGLLFTHFVMCFH